MNLKNQSHKKKKQVFAPQSIIPQVLEITLETLDASQEQLGLFTQAKENPSTLDDYTVNRSLKLYKRQKNDAMFFLEQCNHWKAQNLSWVEEGQVEEIEKRTHEIIKITTELLEILDYCKDLTIDKILAKDPLELAIETLTGKIPLPKLK